MIFWIDKVLVPDGYIFDDKDYRVYQQREYKKASMEIEDAKALFNNIVDNYLSDNSTGITILQMTVQVGPKKDNCAIGARAVIDNTSNYYLKNKDIIKTFYDKVMQAAHKYETGIQKASKAMKISFEFEWYTDSDYFVRDEELKRSFKLSPLQCLSSINWYGGREDDIGSLVVNFESENREACLRSLSDLLNRLSVSMSVSSTHNWLVKDLYEMFEDAIKQSSSLYKKKLSEPLYIHTGLSGNYDGTNVNITISE